MLVYGFEIDGVRLTDNTAWSFPTVPSMASRVKASPENGFSVISYTGNATVGATFGHGLNAAPEFFIFKIRSDTGSWYTYHKSYGATKYLTLDRTHAAVANSYLNNTEPTSSVITLNNTHEVNGVGQDIICYAWTSVSGYSSVGSYTGNGNASGPFVFTGFKVSWLMVKRSDVGGSGYDWFIWDDQRDSSNVVTQDLRANSAGAETTTTRCDFLSNGFKIRGANSDFNTSGGTYIYLAFAEHSLKTARAR